MAKNVRRNTLQRDGVEQGSESGREKARLGTHKFLRESKSVSAILLVNRSLRQMRKLGNSARITTKIAK
jgi:hypothetical protein